MNDMNQNNAAQAANKDIREGFELTYAADADDPACAADLFHFTNGWRACIMSQGGKPVVMKIAVDATAAIDLINDEAARLRAPVAPAVPKDTQEYTLRAMGRNYSGGHSWDRLDTECVTAAADEIRVLRAALASAPVAAQQPAAAPRAQDAPALQYHILKTDPAVFQAVLSGAKTFEIRLNDRGFAVGDVLGLRETKHTGAEMRAGAPLEYTGRECQRFVSHVLTGYGLAEGWCCLSFKLPHAGGESAPVAGEAVAWAVFAPNGNIRYWHHDKANAEAFAAKHGLSLCGLADAAPQASPIAEEAVTDEMIRAGAKAAREYFERTGGHDPAVIYRAMRAAAPAAPQVSAEDVLEMPLCEARMVTLQIGRAYRFVPVPGCAACDAEKAKHDEAYHGTPGKLPIGRTVEPQAGKDGGQQRVGDDLINALGECRDAFPIPDIVGSRLDLLWQEAMSDPTAVPAYVKACAARAALSATQPEQGERDGQD
ncbi:DUF3850 domain-containing protein [Achromobacter xylosoxidans]|uniref:DUF3850 domain-containing protein n=2 Tax=Alcaligenes xylosoxydans xylosoxydans TaxID=85698 RepID=UPI002922037E|nr:DUF3850 domain-containing protein [Achromobacter xylosoxidans]BEG74477.1 hypothetical protein HBIAX_01524 [Achromobacter xylosoxidans]